MVVSRTLLQKGQTAYWYSTTSFASLMLFKPERGSAPSHDAEIVAAAAAADAAANGLMAAVRPNEDEAAGAARAAICVAAAAVR